MKNNSTNLIKIMEACIIGGGFSGIISAKICIDYGLTPFVLNKGPEPGGL
jgi:Predicted flavoprotein involved in K+ transport